MKRLIAIALVMRYQNVLGLFTHQNVLGLFTHQTTYVTNWPVRQGFAKVSSTIYIYIFIGLKGDFNQKSIPKDSILMTAPKVIDSPVEIILGQKDLPFVIKDSLFLKIEIRQLLKCAKNDYFKRKQSRIYGNLCSPQKKYQTFSADKRKEKNKRLISYNLAHSPEVSITHYFMRLTQAKLIKD